MPNRLSAFLVLLLLSGLLLAAAGAQGASAEPVASASAVEEEFEGLEDETEEEESEDEAIEAECETAREEATEGELGLDEVNEICAEVAEAGKRKKAGKKSTASGSAAPEECLLRSAHAHAALDEASGKLKLTLGYTAYEPVGARIKVGNVVTVSRQLGRSGVLRIVEPVGEKHLKRLVVSLKLRAVKSAGCPFRRLVLFPR